MQSHTHLLQRTDRLRFVSCLATALLLAINVDVFSAQTNLAPDAPLLRAHELSAAGEPAAARVEYSRLASDTNASVALRSIAQLSLARSWRM